MRNWLSALSSDSSLDAYGKHARAACRTAASVSRYQTSSGSLPPTSNLAPYDFWSGNSKTVVVIKDSRVHPVLHRSCTCAAPRVFLDLYLSIFYCAFGSPLAAPKASKLNTTAYLRLTAEIQLSRHGGVRCQRRPHIAWRQRTMHGCLQYRATHQEMSMMSVSSCRGNGQKSAAARIKNQEKMAKLAKGGSAFLCLTAAFCECLLKCYMQ